VRSLVLFDVETRSSVASIDRAPVSDLVAAAEAVGGVVSEHADEGERLRRLPQATVDALVAAGLTRMCVPAVYGGPEADPLTVLEAIEAVAHADGAAGWCTMIAATTSSLAVFLPPPAAELIYGDPAVVTGGVFAPNGTGTVDAHAVTARGRWAWGSGTQHCRWVVAGVRCDDEAMRLCFFDATDVTFHDTWHASGLRGTGSLDFSVDGAIVPLERTFRPFVDGPAIDAPLGRFPNFTLLASGVAATSLGIGRRALDELTALAAGKRPQFSSRTLAENPFTQIELARAEARLRSAQAFLHHEVADAWDLVLAGDPVPLADRVTIRLAAVNAAQQGAEAADAAYTLAGGTSVYTSSVLQRCQRDAHVPTQHIQVAPKLYETIGRALLDQDVDASML
jgi:alkylation response protein AidB-like acyl-CoA dehydrogenase